MHFWKAVYIYFEHEMNKPQSISKLLETFGLAKSNLTLQT